MLESNSISHPRSAVTNNLTSAQFATDRLAAFGRGDVGAILDQYADDAIVVTAAGVLRGKAQIRAMIEGIVGEFAQPGVQFELASQQAIDHVVMFTWSARTGANVYDLGAETYVLENGRAVVQTFAAKVTPR